MITSADKVIHTVWEFPTSTLKLILGKKSGTENGIHFEQIGNVKEEAWHFVSGKSTNL